MILLPPLHVRLIALFAALWCGPLGCRGELITLGQRMDVVSGDTTVDDTTVDASTVDDTTVDATMGDATVDVTVDDATVGTVDNSTNDTTVDNTSIDAAVDAAVEPMFRAPRVSSPVVVPVIGSDDKDDNPTLTADLLEIYFTSTRSGDTDVWFAKRESADVDFGEPEQLTVVNTSEFESSPAVARDGLTLWVARRVDGGPGGLDIYVSQRESRDSDWSAPELVSNLSSSGDDIPRPPGAGGLRMPLSVRPEDDTYQLHVATRDNEQAEFGTPSLLQSLVRQDYGSVDGFLTWDGEYLLFSYTRDEVGDLYVAHREGSEFSSPLPLEDVNTESDERDPWVSEDGALLYFASDRDGTMRIYQASLNWD